MTEERHGTEDGKLDVAVAEASLTEDPANHEVIEDGQQELWELHLDHGRGYGGVDSRDGGGQEALPHGLAAGTNVGIAATSSWDWDLRRRELVVTSTDSSVHESPRASFQARPR